MTYEQSYLKELSKMNKEQLVSRLRKEKDLFEFHSKRNDGRRQGRQLTTGVSSRVHMVSDEFINRYGYDEYSEISDEINSEMQIEYGDR